MPKRTADFGLAQRMRNGMEGWNSESRKSIPGVEGIVAGVGWPENPAMTHHLGDTVNGLHERRMESAGEAGK